MYSKVRNNDRLLLIAACILPLIVLTVVLRLGVNVPFSDEWDWIPYLYHEQLGTLTLAELWRQHNEHRMFFTSVLVMLLAKLGGWNLIREEVVSVVLCAASQFVLWLLIDRTLPKKVVPLAFLAMSLELWNLGQAENFAMGLQMGWLLMQLCILIVVWRLAFADYNTTDIVIAAFAATVASYSSEIGLLAWPVGLCAMLLAHGSRKLPALISTTCGIVVYAFFRVGLMPTEYLHVSILDHETSLVLYSLAYLGVPTVFWSGLAGCVLAGSILSALLVAFIATDLRAVRAGNDKGCKCAPWYSLSLFAILGAIGTGPNRLGIGLEGVVTSTRYILIGSWLTIAIIALIAMRSSNWGESRSSRLTPSSAFIIGLMIVTSFSWIRGYRDWQHFSLARHADVRALENGDMLHLAPYYGNRAVLLSDVAELRQLKTGPLKP